MKKAALFIITLCALTCLLLCGCNTLKNGLAEPKNLSEITLPPPHYDSVYYKTGWSPPYDVFTAWEKHLYRGIVEAKPDTSKKLPISLRTYTIPVPTQK